MFGMNILRLHQKVNSERWYYHADTTGVAVFQVQLQRNKEEERKKENKNKREEEEEEGNGQEEERKKEWGTWD
jgi:hypothetical protein